MGFGEYLVNKGVITKERHDIALHLQNKKRLLGVLAEEEKYMTAEEVCAVMDHVEGEPDVMFGEAAVSMGYLTSNQLRYLLDVRTRRKVRIGDILVQNGFINEETLHRELMNFNAGKKRLNKILICEPSQTVAKILERMLAKYGYTVLFAKTGGEAMGMAKEAKPDILITSATLSDTDGYKLCFNILSDPPTSGIQSVILFSDIDKKRIDAAFDAGVNHFLKKPVQENELINIICQLEKEAEEKRPEHILVVDDSPVARALISQELSPQWAHIHMAANGGEALEKAKIIKPDIITMDVEMPVMDGLETCRRLKEDPVTQDIPVIFITAHNTPEFREKGFEVGGVEYFSKPFMPGHLTAFIKMLLEVKKISKTGNILVVDDSGTTRHILKYFFTKNGYNVYSAEDGVEAMKALEKTGMDVVVTDCYMPEMDGFTLVQKMKKDGKHRRIPIIMITASSNKSDVLKGLAAGASDYLTKPFDESELLSRVTIHMKVKRLFEQLEEEKKALRKSNESLKQTLEQLQSAQAQLLRTKKLASIGILSAGVAHEILNPLNIIGTTAQLTMMDEPKGEIHEKMREILGQIQRAVRIVKNLGMFASKSRMEVEEVHLHAIFDQAASFMERDLKADNIIIERHFDPGAPPIKGGANHLEQVFAILISNARDAMSPRSHGTITVATRSVEHGIEFRFCDDGPGIPADIIEKVFDPFFTTKDPGKGTGLGLSIAHRIIEDHGGTLAVESEAGKTCFTIFLPNDGGPVAAG